jgi:hypothetical protein
MRENLPPLIWVWHFVKLRHVHQTCINKDGKPYHYWALVESYRTARGPRHRTVAYLGEMDKAGRLGVQQAA